jgi:tRNA A-37 threonylcarbamoyl transferase component Bud32
VAISYIKNMIKPNMQKATQHMTFKVLRKADRAVPVPFNLELFDNEAILRCDKVVRIIPKKRLVAYGVWNGQRVVAKLFYESSKASDHLTRDIEGVEALVESGIPTPKVLYQGVSQDKRISIIIFERILESKNLEDIWRQKKNIEEVTPLMKHITLELATQHVLGIVQKDLHLKNFLITKRKIYTLDGGSIDWQEDILSKEDSIKHLALFFSQLGVGTEKLQQYLFDVYVKARSWIVRPADCELLQKSLEKYNKSRWIRYLKKIFRNSSSFAKIETTRQMIMYDREYVSDEFLNFLKNPDVIFIHPDTQMLKPGRSSTVVKVNIGGKTLVVKRYNMKSVGHWLRRCLRVTRAATSWRLAHRLQLFGVPTAKPVAFIEYQFLGLHGTSYFVMEHIEGKNLGDYFVDYDENQPLFSEMAEKVMAVINNLAKLYITHGDLKSTNILVHDEQPMMIDLDGMVEHNSWAGLNRAWDKEIQRFMKNWENRPAVRALFERVAK